MKSFQFNVAEVDSPKPTYKIQTEQNGLLQIHYSECS